jgi:hypothetical protein
MTQQSEQPAASGWHPYPDEKPPASRVYDPVVLYAVLWRDDFGDLVYDYATFEAWQGEEYWDCQHKHVNGRVAYWHELAPLPEEDRR